MLEFKDVRLECVDGAIVDNLSFTVREGEIVGVEASSKCVCKSIIVYALGLEPLANGYVTLDYELMTVRSSPFFRKQIAYVPYDLSFIYQSVKEMVDDYCLLEKRGSQSEFRRKMETEWQRIGLPRNIMNERLVDVDVSTLRLIILSMVYSSNKKTVLLDRPFIGEQAADDKLFQYIQTLSRAGKGILIIGVSEKWMEFLDKFLKL